MTITIMTALFLAAFLFGLGAVFEAMHWERKYEIEKEARKRDRLRPTVKHD